jgi:hypothetical protein
LKGGKVSAKFPEQIFEVGGNHKVAIERTADIHQYVDQALACLKTGYEDCAPYLRAGLVRQGYDYLDTVIRFAKCAQDELKREYVDR